MWYALRGERSVGGRAMMRAGIELDRAVADALGLGIVHGAAPAKYSTDLNAAFEAAEACGLWEYGHVPWYDVEWGIWPIGALASVEFGGDGEPLVRGETLCEAICRAILVLKGVPS